MSARTFRVVFLDASSLPCGLAFPVGSNVDYQAYESTSAEQVGERISGANVVITNKVRLDSAQLQEARLLELVGVAAAGTDNVDLEAAKRLGVQVRNVPDYGSESVAEHAVATLFALRRNLLAYTAAATDGRWRASPHFCWTGPPIRDVGGTVFGVVGRGRIGEAVARLARGIGMRVVFAETPGFERKHDELPLDELLAQSDAVSLHLPLTPQQLTLMAILLLTSKGAASVSGGAFIVLAATLGSIPGFPVAGLVLVLGVYRFISEGGALVNVIGNGIATLVVAKWEKALDVTTFKRELAAGPAAEEVS